MKLSHLLFVFICFIGVTSTAQKNNLKSVTYKNISSQISLDKILKQKKSDYIITKEHISSLSGIRHVYLRQSHNNLEIYGTESSIHYDRNGNVFKEHNQFINSTSINKIDNDSQIINAKQAIIAVANQMNYKISNLKQLELKKGINQKALYNKAGISIENIPVKLMYYYRKGKKLLKIWELSIAEVNSSDWWNFRVNATTGQIIDKDNWTVSCNIMESHSCHESEEKNINQIGPVEEKNLTQNMASILPGSYNVYAMPAESPNHGSRTIETNPENLIASPFGWHDTNGSTGAEYTSTKGNNVDAYEDGDNPGYRAEGGPGLIFDFPVNTTYSNGDQSEDAVITNLFYWNNIIHDVIYQYGFDEASGNFQENNYGNGGLGSDSVNAEAQDGGGSCNANFATPPDGSNPRMQMFLCGNRDGDLDNLVIIHEYAHGISLRLSNLGGQEQMGEGWSDYYGLMWTMENGDNASDSRGVGTWLFGQGPNGGGVRQYPYSTDFVINPHTYDDIKNAAIPHGVGSVFAMMLWEMTWELIDDYGFDPDFYNGTGGNNMAVALVTEALKLQPSQPGFVDGRDAILAADVALFGGANQCAIWQSFARRGLGYSANQGSSSSNQDGTESFDLPPDCSTAYIVLTCPNDLDGIVCGDDISPSATGMATAFSSCDPNPIITFQDTMIVNNCGNTGVLSRIWTATDNCGSPPVSCEQEIVIGDYTAPSIDIVANDNIVECNGTGNTSELNTWLANNGGAVASDACSAITWTNDFTILNNDVCGSLTTVTFIATDECGNAITTSADFIIEDTTAPVIGCPGDVTAVTEDGDCGAIVNFQPAVAIDNCGSAFTYQTGGLGSGSVFPVGDTLIEYTAQDDCGNLATCTFTVTVIDDDAPVAICQDITVILDDTGNATITADQLNFGSNDNCGVESLAINVDTFDCSNVGANQVTLTVTDIHGNTATCVASVTVLDNTAPIAVCQDITLELGNNGTVTIDPLDVDGGSSDACGIVSYELDMDTFDCSNLGTTTVILTVTDTNGNQNSCSAIVTLEDNTPPVLVCNDTTVELNQDGVAFITPSLVADIDDNCGTGAVTVDVQEVSCADIGTPVTVNVFANDGNGNSAVCSAVVTVVDLLAPEIVCPDDQVVNLGPDGTYTLGDYIGDGSATATDNCTDPVTIFTQDPVAGSVLGFGTQVITFTAEDQYGNASTCSFELDIQEILGAGDIEDFASLILYPNPADSKVNLSNPRQIDLNNVTIYDLTGRIVHKVDLSTMGSEITIDIATLANATYMLVIRGDQGISTKQLIVNNY